MGSKIIIYILGAFLFFVSCLDNEFDDPNTEFALFAALDDNEEFFEVGDDQIRVLGVRMVVDNVRLNAVNDDEEFASNPSFINLNNFSFQNEVLIGASEIFGGSYTGVSVDLILPPSSLNINDPNLVERDEDGNVIKRNTFVIQGIYNGEAFFIVSDDRSTLSFSFDRNINLPEKLGTLRVVLLAEWKEWFLTDDRTEILDPGNPENREEILNKFYRFFTPLTFTLGEV